MEGPLHDLLKFEFVVIVHGYVCVRFPEYPRSWATGYVPLSRLVMENKLGRKLKEDEQVFYLDGDRMNCNPGNLTLERPSKITERACPNCNKMFRPTKNAYIHCSPKCARKARQKVVRPTKTELKKLVWSMPTSRLAEKLGVSDVSILKWCRIYGIKKPPRGYWQKKQGKKNDR